MRTGRLNAVLPSVLAPSRPGPMPPGSPLVLALIGALVFLNVYDFVGEFRQRGAEQQTERVDLSSVASLRSSRPRGPN